MKRILAAVAAVLIVGAIAAAIGTSGAGASTSQERSSQGIVVGHYEGRDNAGHHIRFYVVNHHQFQLTSFRINHVELGGILFEDAKFSYDCNAQDFCAHGHWTNSDHVSGGWRHRVGHTFTYTAHWVENWADH